MDRAQVVMILGEPDSTEFKNDSECLHYVYVEDYNPTTPLYNEDTERAFSELNSGDAFKQYEYEVILVDNKVINYKEVE